ncbi:MAG: acetyl-CoA carboxylase biotin carboxylase subunit [Alphaproteobacteria bacterium]
MFRKILIANRGEIACRVIRTAKRMGIATVAVYSEADADALHVRMADEAVPIGPPPAAESYLKADVIIEAAKQTGAEAIHPGFGFLSEKAAFAAAVEQAGLVFIGPPAPAIAAMGDKIESKKLARAAGVSTVPGLDRPIEDLDEAVKVAAEIGYPVMIKAAAGGGGKGMRLAHSEAALRESMQSAINEATASFGDGRVFIEKFIVNPRHIEIQVLADKHGHAIHLNERECSIQRRHQKVIEEAPSPLLDAKTRKAMGEQAIALAKAVGYHSAGTVEFVADQDRHFYFLEMNTRLQVEHPVTELTTGIDLVEQMIRVAAGEKLALKQADVKLDGWAIEARVYAEDPTRGFVPSIGRLTDYREPPLGGTLRIDTGVEEGAEISMFYDPMIAKVIAHGKDRAEAIARLRDGLDAYCVRGISHNVGFLSDLLGHPRFAEGRLSTGFIEEEYPEGYAGAALTPDALDVIVAVAATVHHRLAKRARQISGQAAGIKAVATNEWSVAVGNAEHLVTVQNREARLVVERAGARIEVESGWTPADRLFVGRVNGRAVTVQVDRNGTRQRLFWRGIDVPVAVRSRRAAEFAARMPEKKPPDLSRFLLSPMPGLVVAIPVHEGDMVKAGQPVAIVDAMKMENVLRAERDGRVAKIRAAKGDSLAVDQVIMEFE